MFRSGPVLISFRPIVRSVLVGGYNDHGIRLFGTCYDRSSADLFTIAPKYLTLSFMATAVLMPAIVFFPAPDPGAARIGHSGRHPETRQNVFLQGYPENQEP